MLFNSKSEPLDLAAAQLRFKILLGIAHTEQACIYCLIDNGSGSDVRFEISASDRAIAPMCRGCAKVYGLIDRTG